MADAVRLADTSDIPAGTAREFTVGDRVVAVFNVEGSFYALDGICPHAGGPLAKGPLRGTVITCPWHGWQFDVSTGRHCHAPRIEQPCLPLEVRDGGIFVTIAD